MDLAWILPVLCSKWFFPIEWIQEQCTIAPWRRGTMKRRYMEVDSRSRGSRGSCGLDFVGLAAGWKRWIHLPSGNLT